jgi:predicted phage terminase large subunit-like protein
MPCHERSTSALKTLEARLAQQQDQALKASQARTKRKVVSRQKRVEKVLEKSEAPERTPRGKIEAELASRELARRDLLHYLEKTFPSYEPGWVHEDICRRLEKFVKDVEDRKSPRLMLWLPPRSGKSEIASTRFPAWVLGRHPEWEFIMASYSVDLPLGFSRKVRAQVLDPEFQAIFPTTKLSKDSMSAESWRTTKGGGLRAAGVGGGVTGMGSHCFVIDDPIKDREASESEKTRELIWNWYSSTAYTRLAPGGGMLLIQTRWSDDDLAGRLERQMTEALRENDTLQEAAKEEFHTASTQAERDQATQLLGILRDERRTIDQWEIVSYPALATHDEYLELKTGRIIRNDFDGYFPKTHYKPLRPKGEALHPERFPRQLLLRYKRTLAPRDWAALYQQNPVPEEGAVFTKEMFIYRPHLPDRGELYTFAAWDLAIGTKRHNDYTVGFVGGLDWEDNLWILHMVRARWGNMDTVAREIIDLAQRYECVLTGIEKGQLELALKPHLSRIMKEKSLYIPLAEGDSALRPIADKVSRAGPLQGRMQQGRVLFPDPNAYSWVSGVEDELLRFPSGVHDDMVDALAWLARMVANHAPPPQPGTKQRRLPDGYLSWKDRLTHLLPGNRGGAKAFMGR